MRFPFRIFFALVCVGLAATIAAAPATAAVIQTASGNTFVQDRATAGTLNYAVLNTSGGGAGDPWGIGALNFTAASGSGALDTGANYLYLYQVTNATDAGILLDNMTLTLTPGANLTSWGYFGGQGLADVDGAVTASNTAGTSGNDFGSPGPTGVPSLGVTDPSVTSISGGATPSAINALSAFGIFNAAFPLAGADDMLPGDRSVIFGFTSDQAPTFTDFLLRSPLGPASGLAPSPVPGPTTLLGLASLLPFAGMYFRRRWWPSRPAQ